MLCKAPVKPARHEDVEFNCGRCMPCRINKAREWVARLMLESLLHRASTFCTLTYDPKHLPADLSVSVEEGQRFIRELRRLLREQGREGLRFYLVGEYGERLARPHYHAILFGVHPGQDQTLVEKAWGKGFVKLGLVNSATCSYTCSYVMKKLTKKGDKRLEGRHPEFARMSLRPGIGADSMKAYGKMVLTDPLKGLEVNKDVPAGIVLQGRNFPLGRYLRIKLREAVGMEKTASREALELRVAQRYAELMASDAPPLSVRRQISARRAEWLRRFQLGKGKL